MKRRNRPSDFSEGFLRILLLFKVSEPSATLGSTSAFQGTIMADQAIAMNSGATIDGRLLARIAVVTMDSDTIVKTIAMSGGATPARGRHRAGRAA